MKISKKMMLFAVVGASLIAVTLAAISPALAEVSSTNQKIPEISGSVNVKQTMKDYISKNTITSFSDAASIAQKEVTNGSVVSGHIGINQGFLVYTFCVMDTQNEKSYMVLVDVGNGKVLYKSEAMDFNGMGGFGHGFGMGKFGHGGFAGHFGKMMPSQDIPQESQ